MPEDFNPPPGVPIDLAPGLRRILAPNPSPMTFRGTNTYLLGTRGIAVIDPGPDHKGHLAAILQALAPDQRVTHIIVTHSHLDHAPLSSGLSRHCGAPVLAFGGPTSGRSRIMQELAREGFASGGEGVDMGFAPDITVKHADHISGDGWDLEVIHTPGHLGNHICLGWGDSCFTADHVMGWSTSLVSPPDGDLTDFMASCHRLRQRPWHRFYPGHGDTIEVPHARLDWLIAHRHSREREILGVLARGASTPGAIADHIYTDIPETLKPAAARNVLAHLVDLVGKSIVAPDGTLSATTMFHLIDRQE